MWSKFKLNRILTFSKLSGLRMSLSFMSSIFYLCFISISGFYSLSINLIKILSPQLFFGNFGFGLVGNGGFGLLDFTGGIFGFTSGVSKL